MKITSGRLLLIVALMLTTFGTVPGQFGQNKISYADFDWQVYESPHFDIHYYPEIEPFLEEIVSYAESAYLKISRELDHELRFRVPLIVYRTAGEFQQTNITLAEVPEGVAAFAEPLQYRMVLPIDEPPDKLYHLIAHELVHIFQYSMFYEGSLGRILRGRPPLWVMEGMASYLADDEDSLDRMAIRDAVVNNILPSVRQLNVLSFMTYRYGHAIFDFIEQEHGIEGLRSFIFELKKVLLTGNLGKAIKESFGYDIEEFDRRFNRYLRKKYFPVLLEKKSPDDYGKRIIPRGKNPVSFSPSLSPSGELIAALAVPRMEVDLVVVSAEDGSIVKNVTKGWSNHYRHLITEVFAGKNDLSWSPAGDEIAVFARRENKWPLMIYNSLNGKRVREFVFDDIVQCASPRFSPDGRRIAFEGNRDGVVDLFEVDLDTGTVRNLTQDDFFDANPWYSADGKTLLYNRRIGSYWKIFSVDLSDPSKKTQLTFGLHSDIQPSYSRDGKTIYFSSDRGPYGVFNINALDLATGDVLQYTDVVGGCFSPVEMADRDGETQLVFSAFFEGTFQLYRMPLRSFEEEIKAAERMSLPVEAEPFEPDLQLRIDEDNKVPYRKRWSLSSLPLEIGVTNDGTFLANAALQFSDLMGNQRISLAAQTVSDVASIGATYVNVRKRYNWGANVYDFRDFFIDPSTGQNLRLEYRETGGSVFADYPLNRYYRIEGSLGVADSKTNQLVFDQNGQAIYVPFEDQLVLSSFAIVGDTTRFQSFGPFQGKRFRVSARYGVQPADDFPGDLLEYRADFRFYQQITRRSLVAWRVAGIVNSGEREYTYGFGGLNQLRGYEFRQFFGSNMAWSNLEIRFPLVDQMRFPVLALNQIRGFFFLDVGAAVFQDEIWFDPEFGPYGDFRTDPTTGEPVRFQFWDSENGQLRDGRGSYGFGFQFFFIGGLQFNWVWANRLPYTRYTLVDDPDNPGNLIPAWVDGDTDSTRSEFYIAFDW